jgi:hypothetical protein
MDDWFARLRQDGYALLPGVFSPAEVEAARRGVADALADPAAADSILASEGQPPHGARNLLRIWPGAVTLARSPALAGPVLRVVGPGGLLVRGLYFDKPPGEGWALPWHRDTAIAVRAHGPLGRFRKPTHKSGVPHIEAPTEVLDDLLVARVHLDDMTDDNGPLRVMPGSHRMDAPEVEEGAAETLHCQAGVVLLMRPLLLHSSGLCAAGHRGHRRVVHLEFSPASTLPDGYEWHAAYPLT